MANKDLFSVGERVAFSSEPSAQGVVLGVAYIVKWDKEDWGPDGVSFESDFALCKIPEQQ